MTVAVLKAGLEDIDAKVEKIFRMLGYEPKKKKVLLKPNIVYPTSPDTGMVTDPRVVEAVIKFLKRYTDDITIGEGSAVGHDTMAGFRRIGYPELAKKYGVELLDFNNCERTEVKWKYGTLLLPKAVLESEYISLPIMRPHAQTVMTASTKNQKGILGLGDKMGFHKMGLHERIMELSKAIKPDISLVDALVCSEGNVGGPFKKTKKLGLILAGRDVFELDNVCAKVMGIDIGKVKHLLRVETEVIGEDVESVKAKLGLANYKRKLFNACFNLNGCSGCNILVGEVLREIMRSPLLAFRFALFTLLSRKAIVTGPDAEILSEYNKAVCIGNCTKKFADRDERTFVCGCPPKKEDVLKALLGKSGEKSAGEGEKCGQSGK